jgi:tetratricopeptide (TPR) repeat protein
VSVGGFAAFHYYSTRKLEREQSTPSEWSFKTRLFVHSAVDHELAEDFGVAAQCYQNAIDSLVKDSDGNFIDINGKSKAWLAGYSDILIRLGVVQESLGKSQEAKDAINAGYSINLGSVEMKSKAAIQLGRYAVQDDHHTQAEQYFTDAIKYTAGPILLKAVEDAQGALIVPDVALNESQLEPLIELGKLYAKQGRYQEALSSLLSTLRGIRSSKARNINNPRSDFDLLCREAIVMSYIGEILWALGNKRDAVVWAEGSYYEAWPKSHTIAECGLCAKMAAANVAKMYRKLGMNKESDEFYQLSDTQQVVELNPKMYKNV